MALEAFTPRVLTSGVRKLRTPRLFLFNTFFTRRNNWPTNMISFGVLNGNAKLVPYTRPGEPAIPVDFISGDLKSFAPPILNPKKIFDENKAETLNPGLDTYRGPFTDPNTQIAEKIALEQQDLLDKINRTVEVQCAQAIEGGEIIFAYNDNTSASLSFGYTGDGSTEGDALTIQPTLDGTDAWDSAGSDPVMDIRRWQRQIQENSDWSGPVALLLGWEAADALLKNDSVRKLLDVQRMNAGNLTIASQNGFTYLGELAGVPIWQYVMGYQNAAGVYTAAFSSKKAVMLPQGSDYFTVEYGAVFDRPNGQREGVPEFIRTDYFSKMVSKEDPPVLELSVISKPAAIIKNVDPIRVCQVVG